jgi:hypothetical protein
VPQSACAANPASSDVRLRIRQESARRGRATMRVIVSNAGDAPASALHLRMRPPGGWSAGYASMSVSPLAAGRATSRVWTLRAPRGRRSGSLRVEAMWNGPGGSGRALRAFATGTASTRR